MKLTIELVPSTSWFSNIRSEVSPYIWDIIRKEVYKKANYKCEVCGGKGAKWPAECHEIWEYDDTNHNQILTGLIALCPDCHRVKHIDHASTLGHEIFINATKHLAKVNNLDFEEAKKYIIESFEIYKQRSQYLWNLDLKYLEINYSTKLKEKSFEK